MFGLITWNSLQRNSKWVASFISWGKPKILVNMEIVSNSYYVCIKFMFLSKNHDIWKWIVFFLLSFTKSSRKIKTVSSLSIISGISISQKLVLQKFICFPVVNSSRDKKYRILPYAEILSLIHSKTIHITSSQIIPKCITLIQITNWMTDYITTEQTGFCGLTMACC